MSAADRQLTLDLPQRPALDRADFLVAEANEVAVTWIDRWPDWPQSTLVLYGPGGSGKTHLGAVWRRKSGAALLDAAALADAEPPALLGRAPAALVDGVDGMLAASGGGDELERRLLHLYNMLRERGGHLLLTARQPPARWDLRLADLRSRVTAAPAVALGPPDDRLLAAVLIKLFADRQLRVPPRVVRYLLGRMERSLAAARALVAALDAASLAARREITVPLARRVLEEMHADHDTYGEDDHGFGNSG